MLAGEEEIHGYFDAVDAWMVQIDSPWVTIMDFSQLDTRASTVAHRKAFADRAKETQMLAEEHCVGLAAIAPSVIISGIVNSVMIVVPRPFPSRVFTDEKKARAWLLGKLREAAKSTTVRPPPPSGPPRR